ncbi:hypothetical protein EYC84_005273 [Monilinia fructicola]|uniref:Uncharacterized protein n=1 Tax=Monilinia fructicola TaxID=38448 RepID=A0A5M9K139_MONFR|nr:hypothetical protein EYC84_005273 [Monilinia fructicola]
MRSTHRVYSSIYLSSTHIVALARFLLLTVPSAHALALALALTLSNMRHHPAPKYHSSHTPTPAITQPRPSKHPPPSNSSPYPQYSPPTP